MKIKIELEPNDIALLMQGLNLIKQIIDQMSGKDKDFNYPIVSLMVKMNHQTHEAGHCRGKDCLHKDNIRKYQKAYAKQIAGESMKNFDLDISKLFKEK